jgi:hypothetical protein
MLKVKKTYWILYDDQREMSIGTHVPILYATQEEALYARQFHTIHAKYEPVPVCLVLAMPEVEA